MGAGLSSCMSQDAMKNGWRTISMRKLVHELEDENGEKTFKVSWQWFNFFRKRWVLVFMRKQTLKRLPLRRDYLT